MDPEKTVVSGGPVAGKSRFRIIMNIILWTAGFYVLLHLLLVPVSSFLTGSEHKKTNTPKNWGLSFKAHEVKGPIGLDLPGWYVPGASGRPVILVLTGSGGNKYGTISRQTTLALHEKGYNVFLFDTRGQGESRGIKTYGIGEAADVVRVVDYLSRTFPGKKIGAVGFSLGAASVLRAAGVDERLAAVAAYASYSDLNAGFIRSQTEVQIRSALRGVLPKKHRKYADTAAKTARLIVCPALAHLSLKAWSFTLKPVPAPKEAAAGLGNRPLLLMHNDGDPEISSDHLAEIYQAAQTSKKRKLLFHHQGHEPPFTNATFRAQFKQAIQGFFEKAL